MVLLFKIGLSKAKTVRTLLYLELCGSPGSQSIELSWVFKIKETFCYTHHGGTGEGAWRQMEVLTCEAPLFIFPSLGFPASMFWF